MTVDVLYNVPHAIPWKVYIPFYFYFTGLSAGSFILSTFATVFRIERYKPLALPSAIAAFLLLLLAPASLILDLQRHWRFWHVLVPFYFNPTAPVSYGSWLLTIYPIADLFYIWYIWKHDDRMKRTLGIITVPLALAVHAYTGYVFGVTKARAWWNSALMPGYFLTSAVLSGVGLLVMVYLLQSYFKSRAARRQATMAGGVPVAATAEQGSVPAAAGTIDLNLLYDLTKIMVGIIGIDLFWDLSFMLVLPMGTRDAYYSAMYVLHDPLYVGGEIFLGLVVPLILLSLRRTKKSLFWITVASFLVFGGVFLMRYTLVFTGWNIPLN